MDADKLTELIVNSLNAEQMPSPLAPRCWESRKCKSRACRFYKQTAKICWEQNKPECANCSYKKSLSESDVLHLNIERMCASYIDFKRKASIYKQILEKSQGVFKLGQEMKKISHEINNIIGSMKGHIQLATMLGNEQYLNQAFSVVSQGCKRIGDIVEHVRRLRGNTNLSLERPGDYYFEILDSMFPEIQQKKIGWDIKDSKRVWILSKPASLQRFAFQEIKSVLDWLESDGKISVKVEEGKDSNVSVILSARKLLHRSDVPQQLTLPFEDASATPPAVPTFDKTGLKDLVRTELEELNASIKIRQTGPRVRISATLPIIAKQRKR